MYQLSSLISHLQKPKNSLFVAKGHAVWLVWGEIPSATIAPILSSFGGWVLAGAEGHALWFFPEANVLKCMARLYAWSQVEPIRLFAEVFPATLAIGDDFSFGISIDPALATQGVTAPEDFDVLVAGDVAEEIRRLPGLGCVPVPTKEMPVGSWKRMKVDMGFDYSSSPTWFLFIKPIGKPLDRSFVEGWRTYSAHLKDLLNALKITYLYTEDMFLVLHCKTYQTLHEVCCKIAHFLAGKEEGVVAWPCIIIGMEKGHLHFGTELPHKVAIAWDELESNYIHFPLKNIYQIGHPFIPVGSLTSGNGAYSLESLAKMCCNDATQDDAARLKLFFPRQAQVGNFPSCFYCGLRTHSPSECPSRFLLNANPTARDVLAGMDIARIEQVLGVLDQRWNDKPLESLNDGLQKNDDVGRVTTAFFEINAASQLRMMRTVWRSKGKDWPRGLKKLAPQEEDSAWSALHRFRNGDVETAVKNIDAFALHSPRHFKAKTLQGFIAMEKGGYKNALNYWKEAGELCITSLHRSYHLFLRGRLQEVCQEYDAAIALYRNAVKHSPGMLEARYRHAACLVKMGFSEQAMETFLQLIEEDPHYFNLIIIDPELQRGQLHLMSGLGRPWFSARKVALESLKNVDALSNLIERWFTPEHPAYKIFNDRAKRVLAHNGTDNFVPLVRIAHGSAALHGDIQRRVEKDIQELHRNCKGMYEELESIQEEASWFPFARFLRGFNKDFNTCIRELNGVGRLNLQNPESFKKGHAGMVEASSALLRLRDHLKSLLLIRDTTLFTLLFGKNFLWLELGGLTISLIVLPLITMWGIQSGQSWGHDLHSQKWVINKMIIIVVSICALGGAAIWTTMRFEKKRKAFLEKHKK